MKSTHRYILIIATMLVLFLLALVLRGNKALVTLTWGLVPEVTEEPIELEFIPTDTSEVPTPSQFINIGLYTTRDAKEETEGKLAIDHYFIDWDSYDQETLLADLESTISQNRWPMITIEPFANDSHQKDTDLLGGISNGDYDQIIKNVCQDIAGIDHPVFIRFMHEMDHEENFGRYPWVTGEPQQFINSYQYFIDQCRELIPEGYYIWSPVGSEQLSDYYPGDDYVDAIGLSLFSLPYWEYNYYGEVISFDDHFLPKYNRVKQYNKKVIIAELGVAQSANHQESFIFDMNNSLHQYPLLDTVVYFDAVEPYPEGWGLPATTQIDWTIEDLDLIQQ